MRQVFKADYPFSQDGSHRAVGFLRYMFNLADMLDEQEDMPAKQILQPIPKLPSLSSAKAPSCPSGPSGSMGKKRRINPSPPASEVQSLQNSFPMMQLSSVSHFKSTITVMD